MKKLFLIGFLVFLLIIGLNASGLKAAPNPLVLNDGPHLLIDDYLIENSSGIERYARISNYPRTKIVDGMESVENYRADRKWKENAVSDWPVEVHYDPVNNEFRMWHETFLFDNHNCTGTNIVRTMVHRQSSDGIHFTSPIELNYDCRALAYAFSSVIDDKTNTSDRYKTIYGPIKGYENKRGNAPGMGAVSADGINWEFIGPVTPFENDEIWAPFWDPKYQKYGVLHRDYDPGSTTPRRYLCYGETTDFYNWPSSSVPFDVLNESGNFGKTQYYGASNTIRRGDYLIFVKRILRDDLKAEGIPDKINNQQWGLGEDFPVYGIGYSVLAWSRDGEVDANGNRVWHRDKPEQEYVIGSTNILDGQGLYDDLNVFLAPDPKHAPQVASPNNPYNDSTPFDHAHAWVNTLLEMPAGANGETLPMVYMYYGGYKYGHKIYTDRSLGFTKIKKDRFVSRREWGNTGGSGYLETPWIKFDASSLALNLDTAAGARIGSVKLEITKQDGSRVDCGTFSGIDEIAKEVTTCDIAQFANQPVKLKFTISDAYLFAFYLDGDNPVNPSPSPNPSPNPNAGQALVFDGVDDAVVVANKSQFDFTANSSITLEAWIKPTNIVSGQNEIIISKGRDDYAKNFRLYIHGSPDLEKMGLAFFYDDQNNQRHIYQIDNRLLFNNNWYHVAFTYQYGNSQTAKLYINGNQVDGSWVKGNGSGLPQLNEFLVMIGAEELASPNERFNGLIDEARIYNRALTAGEITSHYNQGQGQSGQPDESGLLAGWHFDEASGLMAADYSAHGHDGALVGNPQWVEGLVGLPGVDLKSLILNWGQSPLFAGMDVNSDGLVNGLDFVSLL